MGEAKRRKAIKCHCGSGKQYVSCCMKNDQAPRLRGFTFSPNVSATVTGMRLGSNGQVELLCGESPIAVSDVKSTEWRNTDKGLKIKSEVFSADTAFLSPEHALVGSDYVFGVDTNSTTKDSVTVHVACLTCATRRIMEEGFDGTIQQISCIDFQDTQYSAERIGWVFAIEAIRRSSPAAAAKIVLFTDHDINSHADINAGLAPIIPNYFLPKNFSLAYASDRGSSIQNKVIKAAHKGASQVSKSYFKSNHSGQKVLHHLLQSADAPLIRQWRNDRNSQFFFG